MKSPMVDESATNLSYKVNRFAENKIYYNSHTDTSHSRQSCHKTTNHRESNGSSYDKENEPQINGFSSNGIHSSPLRSQLGLNLKSSNSGAAKKVTKSFQCPICPHSTEHLAILEEHINRMHFDPLSPSVNSSQSSYLDTLNAFGCPICSRTFETSTDLELHVNIEHRDILSPGNIETNGCGATASATASTIESAQSVCPVCDISMDDFTTKNMEIHIEKHFAKSPHNVKSEPDLEKEAQKMREQREFEMLQKMFGMDDQGNFREQSAAAMQSAVVCIIGNFDSSHFD